MISLAINILGRASHKPPRIASPARKEQPVLSAVIQAITLRTLGAGLMSVNEMFHQLRPSPTG